MKMVNVTKVAATRKLLANIVRDYSPLAMYNALRIEDMVLMDLICKEYPAIQLFSVDSGRLPAESHRLLQTIRRIYGDVLHVYYPNAYELQSLVNSQGTNGFFDSADNRRQCCATRIQHPIRRALSGKAAWLRGTCADSRNQKSETKLVSYDFQNGIPLLCPLHQWSVSELWSYIKRYNVPYHSLYDRKFTTIGCEPCTRAASADTGNGKTQWWWEHTGQETEFPDLYIA